MKILMHFSVRAAMAFAVCLAAFSCYTEEPALPRGPFNFTATDATVSSVTLRWGNRQHLPEAHEILVLEGDHYVPVGEVAGTEDHFIVTGLEKNTHYQFALKSRNTQGVLSRPEITTITTHMPWGPIKYSAGVSRLELDAVTPQTISQSVGFTGPLTAEVLSADATAVLNAGNGVGPPVLREAFAMDILQATSGAALVHTKQELVYTGEGSRYDLTVSVADVVLSVNTAGAFTPAGVDLTEAEAYAVLEAGFNRINEARLLIAQEHKPAKSILFVTTTSFENFWVLYPVWQLMPTALKRDAILIITQTAGQDEMLYE